jgi:hypothetical protein
MDYYSWLYGSLYVAFGAALVQVVLAFRPRFSGPTLVNAALLTTVFIPLATDRLDVGTRAGAWLWLANLISSWVLVVRLLLRWANDDFTGRATPPAVVSVVDLLAYGFHVLVFSDPP